MTWKHKRQNQLGFTMVEMIISLAIGSLIVGGALWLLGTMMTTADDNRNKTTASMEVQYSSFWISEDAAQAQNIYRGNNATYGFPLILQWTNSEPDLSGNYTMTKVEYRLVEENSLTHLWKMDREKWLGIWDEDEAVGNASYVPQGITTIGQHLVVAKDNGTYVSVLQDNKLMPLDINGNGNVTEWLTGTFELRHEDPEKAIVSTLILNVTADVHGRIASNTYDIHPRSFSKWYVLN